MSAKNPRPIERYFQIIEIVAASRDGLTLAEISQIANLPKPSAHRLVKALQELDVLVSDETWYKKFRIGPYMRRILQLCVEPEKEVAFAQMTVDRLAAELGETAYVVRMDHDSIRSIARSAPDQGHRLHVLPGEVLPAHAAASAKAILAFQDDATVARFLTPPLDALTPLTKTDVDAVKAEFAQVRETDFAICDREIDENVRAYACPVHIETIGVIHAVGVTGPVTRLGQHDHDHWIAPMKQAADTLAAMLATLKPA
ncbi:MAG: IclR family transcriptional regulator C-terminal domain-containing protein [Roseovarius pacificus]|nr:IclR family transcriptional regulator C-terminal domain-containing protein [Roseovarius pacificus]